MKKIKSLFSIFIRKAIGLYTIVKHRKVAPEYRYFYFSTYYCQFRQLKYSIKDYLTKTKYKEVAFCGEFAPELEFALPFAYWHYKNGTLSKTRSSTYTKELYFFSEDHDECFGERTNEDNYNFEMPRVLYSHNYDMRKWEQVPLKETYKNDIYVFEKPILVIANRYNSEWDGPPISYFDIPMLSFMIEKLKDNYTIIYNRPRPQNITPDNSDVYDMNEYGWLKKEHPEVILMEDLYKENKAKARTFNHLQLMVYANADRFLSIHGGTSALASYFGGINIILSKQGPEHHFGCFQTLFPKLSGAKILHAKTDEEVKQFIEEYYVISPETDKTKKIDETKVKGSILA